MQPVIQGAFIGTGSSFGTLNAVGLLIFVSALVLMVVEGESGLEKEVKKLFVRDKMGRIKMADPDYLIGKEIGHPVYSEDAQDVLDELDKEFRDDDLKTVLRDALKKGGYFEMAYQQRDHATELKQGSIARVADKFLKKWDADYRKFEPPKNKYLAYREDAREKLPTQNAYDSRVAVHLLKKNIEGFEIEDKVIGSHDVHVSYLGARFQVMGGSFHPYEIPHSSIVRALYRVAEEDVKRKHIKESEKAARIEVLRNYIFK